MPGSILSSIDWNNAPAFEMAQKTTIYNRTDSLWVFIGNSSEQVTLTFKWLYVGAKSIFVKNLAPET